ncbi:type II toxin-antitoxin system RelE/ParE family toxin [Sphingomonas sp. AP4-R1]|uniref:type II toxin-antitoxin system RelE/ParE family toxin n=1 Tax=Sphingomonas sp. AP4-R1 TaxID=2735134 RepID=UPI001493645E|nr:type II toxin-antitoxin system RelE/ParE family toxin [Sphingomonas sp. AP4-R1]QJU58857.1 type II toxin-antitoxin system RelE/ParE family toxin [Sphingomonas sp. AP4-R1]
MSHRVVFTREARDELNSLHAYIAALADPETASRFVDGIIDHAATLSAFPKRGTPRDDLRVGLRTIPWRRRVTIAFMVEETDVVVIGIFYGGRDFETLLKSE